MHVHTQPVVLESSWMGYFRSPTIRPISSALSDYHLFPAMMIWLATQYFNSDAEIYAGVYRWLRSQVADLYEVGIEKLVSPYDKCLTLYGD